MKVIIYEEYLRRDLDDSHQKLFEAISGCQMARLFQYGDTKKIQTEMVLRQIQQ